MKSNLIFRKPRPWSSASDNYPKYHVSMGNQRGATLVEMVISSGISFVILGAIIVLTLRQSEDLNALQDRVEVNQTQIEIQRALMDPATCLENFKAPFTIDDFRVTDPIYRVSVPRLVENAAAPRVLVNPGQPLKPSAPLLIVNRIDATNFVRISANVYRFDLKLEVERNGVLLPQMSIPRIRVSTDPASPLNAKVPIRCGSVAAGGLNCRVVEVTSPDTRRASALCDPGERLLNGGAECLAPTDGYLRISRPVNSGGRMGWEGDCVHETNNIPRVKVYASCCS